MSVTNNDDSHGLCGWHCPVEVLESVPDPVLFYPNASRDVETPLSLFAGRVSDFWFSDIAYRSRELEVPAWRSTYRLVGREFARHLSARKQSMVTTATGRNPRSSSPSAMSILTQGVRSGFTGPSAGLHQPCVPRLHALACSFSGMTTSTAAAQYGSLPIRAAGDGIQSWCLRCLIRCHQAP